MNKILVLSPHPDDETLGCGGTLIKYKKKGWKIDIIFFTKMTTCLYSKKEIIRRNIEISKISKLYKFNKIYNFDYPTTSLSQIPDYELISKINNVLKKSKPNIVFYPCEYDIHSDHNKVSRCFLSNVKSFRFDFIQKVYSYEILSETNLNFKYSFKPNHFENISNEIRTKIKILKIFKSEIKKHPFPRSIDSVISLAKLRGSQSSFMFAESFETYFSKNT
tara:strand:- start:786 stop:1445 length:660 start_codon:yes stop_codon:yes gene_type:complete